MFNSTLNYVVKNKIGNEGEMLEKDKYWEISKKVI